MSSTPPTSPSTSPTCTPTHQDAAPTPTAAHPGVAGTSNGCPSPVATLSLADVLNPRSFPAIRDKDAFTIVGEAPLQAASRDARARTRGSANGSGSGSSSGSGGGSSTTVGGISAIASPVAASLNSRDHRGVDGTTAHTSLPSTHAPELRLALIIPPSSLLPSQGGTAGATGTTDAAGTTNPASVSQVSQVSRDSVQPATAGLRNTAAAPQSAALDASSHAATVHVKSPPAGWQRDMTARSPLPFQQISEGVDLKRAPPNWLQSQLPDGTLVPSEVDETLPSAGHHSAFFFSSPPTSAPPQLPPYHGPSPSSSTTAAAAASATGAATTSTSRPADDASIRAPGMAAAASPHAHANEALSMVGALAMRHVGPNTDVIAPVAAMKQLFKLPYTTAPLSLAVHAIGNTLILDTVEPDATPQAVLGRSASLHHRMSASAVVDTPLPLVPRSALKPAMAVQKQELYSKFLYRTLLSPMSVASLGPAAPPAHGAGAGAARVGAAAAASAPTLARVATGVSGTSAGEVAVARLRASHPALSIQSPHAEPTVAPASGTSTSTSTGTGTKASASAGPPRGEVMFTSSTLRPPAAVVAAAAAASCDAPALPHGAAAGSSTLATTTAPAASSPAVALLPPTTAVSAVATAAAVDVPSASMRPRTDSIGSVKHVHSPVTARHPTPSASAAATAAPGAPAPPSARFMPHQEPRAFRQVSQWSFRGLNMVLGSDLIVFGKPGHERVSLQLQDVEQPMTQADGIDMFLDNVMANVPEVAMCFHKAGVVKGYNLVPTEQIPAMASFSPYLLEKNAAALLQFLRQNCVSVCGTYWLWKGEGEARVQLYDLSSLSNSRMLRWKYMMAMLCYRYASQLRRVSQPTEEPVASPPPRNRSSRHRRGSPQQRQPRHATHQRRARSKSLGDNPPDMQGLLVHRRELLIKCGELLEEVAQGGGRSHLAIQAEVHTELARGYMQEATDTMARWEQTSELAQRARTPGPSHSRHRTGGRGGRGGGGGSSTGRGSGSGGGRGRERGGGTGGAVGAGGAGAGAGGGGGGFGSGDKLRSGQRSRGRNGASGHSRGRSPGTRHTNTPPVGASASAKPPLHTHDVHKSPTLLPLPTSPATPLPPPALEHEDTHAHPSPDRGRVCRRTRPSDHDAPPAGTQGRTHPHEAFDVGSASQGPRAQPRPLAGEDEPATTATSAETSGARVLSSSGQGGGPTASASTHASASDASTSSSTHAAAAAVSASASAAAAAAPPLSVATSPRRQGEGSQPWVREEDIPVWQAIESLNHAAHHMLHGLKAIRTAYGRHVAEYETDVKRVMAQRDDLTAASSAGGPTPSGVRAGAAGAAATAAVTESPSPATDRHFDADGGATVYPDPQPDLEFDVEFEVCDEDDELEQLRAGLDLQTMVAEDKSALLKSKLLAAVLRLCELLAQVGRPITGLRVLDDALGRLRIPLSASTPRADSVATASLPLRQVLGVEEMAALVEQAGHLALQRSATIVAQEEASAQQQQSQQQQQQTPPSPASLPRPASTSNSSGRPCDADEELEAKEMGEDSSVAATCSSEAQSALVGEGQGGGTATVTMLPRRRNDVSKSNATDGAIYEAGVKLGKLRHVLALVSELSDVCGSSGAASGVSKKTNKKKTKKGITNVTGSKMLRACPSTAIDFLFMATRCYELVAAVHFRRRSPSEYMFGDAINRWGQNLLASGDFIAAAEVFSSGVEVFESVDDKENAALLMCNIVHILRLLGLRSRSASDGADKKPSHPRPKSSAPSSELVKAALLPTVGSAALFDTAVTLCTRAYNSLSKKKRVTEELAQCYLSHGVCLARSPRMLQSDDVQRRAHQLLAKALNLYKDAGNRKQVAACHYQLGHSFFLIVQGAASGTCVPPDRLRMALNSATSHFGQAMDGYRRFGGELELCDTLLVIVKDYTAVFALIAQLNKSNLPSRIFALDGALRTLSVVARMFKSVPTSAPSELSGTSRDVSHLWKLAETSVLPTFRDLLRRRLSASTSAVGSASQALRHEPQALPLWKQAYRVALTTTKPQGVVAVQQAVDEALAAAKGGDSDSASAAASQCSPTKSVASTKSPVLSSAARSRTKRRGRKSQK